MRRLQPLRAAATANSTRLSNTQSSAHTAVLARRNNRARRGCCDSMPRLSNLSRQACLDVPPQQLSTNARRDHGGCAPHAACSKLHGASWARPRSRISLLAGSLVTGSVAGDAKHEAGSSGGSRSSSCVWSALLRVSTTTPLSFPSRVGRATSSNTVHKPNRPRAVKIRYVYHAARSGAALRWQNACAGSGWSEGC